jgi:predicted nucleotidyltransferase
MGFKTVMAMQKEYEGLIKEFIGLLRDHFHHDLISVALYGSVAQGTAKKDSDIDLCIIIKHLPESRYQRYKIITPLLQRLRESPTFNLLYKKGYYPEISTVLFTVNEMEHTASIFLDMVEGAEILIDDGTFGRKLNVLKERLNQLGSQKIYLDDGTYYWLLKPDIKFGEIITL